MIPAFFIYGVIWEKFKTIISGVRFLLCQMLPSVAPNLILKKCEHLTIRVLLGLTFPVSQTVVPVSAESFQHLPAVVRPGKLFQAHGPAFFCGQIGGID